jgi:predicted porin
MKCLTIALLASAGVVCAGAQAADLPTTKPTEAPAPASRPCFDSLWDYMDSTPSECPLTWKGITLFGVIDAGYGYSSHGANFNGAYPQGVAELIAKNSQGYKWQFVPSGLQRSSIGLDAKEEFAPGWSFVGRVTAAYDPYSLQFSNGPKSLVENNNLTIGNQSANSDSSRAGQFDNSQGYVGVSNTTYGTLTVGRQNAFSDEIQYRYDPNGGDYAFSLLGNSSTYLNGVGDTETARYNSVVKYTVAYNNLHAGALWQFGGYELGNGSDGAFQFDGGGDFAGFSFDAIYSYARDAVSLSTYSADPLPKGVSQDDLKATLADISGVILAGKYTYHQLTLYSGYEFAVFMPPSYNYPGGFGTLGGYNVLPGAVNSTAYIDNKHLQVAWTGVKYAVRSDLDISGAYYIAHQNDYRPPGAKSTVCGPNTVAAAPGASPQGSLNTYCAGDLQAVSFLIDYRPLKRLDVYGGMMYSIASGGIASGYIHSNNFAPTVGVQLSF